MSITDPAASARYSRLRWNSPLAPEHADLLLNRLATEPGDRVLDLGCGWGELLLQTLATTPPAGGGRAGSTGTGVDIDDDVLARGRELADARGSGDRVRLVRGRAQDWDEPAERVLCLGAAHAFGGTRAALGALTRVVRPGGRLLFGDAYWERPPSEAAVQIFGDQVLPLGELVDAALERGWRVLHLSVADQREWDDFESCWRAGQEEWLLARPDHPDAATIRDRLDARLREYLGVYRTVLGFAYLVLAPTADPGPDHHQHPTHRARTTTDRH